MKFASMKRTKALLASALGTLCMGVITMFVGALAMADPLDMVDDIEPVPADIVIEQAPAVVEPVVIDTAEPYVRPAPVYSAPTPSPWYVGANIGQSRADIDAGEINDHLVLKVEDTLEQWVFTDTTSEDEDDIGYKIYGGYKFNKNFAVEGGYFNLGEFSYKSTTDPAGTLNGEIEVDGLNLDLVGILPLTERVAAFARAGVTYAESDGNFSATGAASGIDRNSSEQDTNYKYGLGVQYAVTESLGVRAEAERYRIKDVIGDNDDIDFYSLGLVYRFGGSTPVPAPAYVAPEPVAVMTPAPTKVHFSADSMFDFGSSYLRPAGKSELDKFAADLRDIHFDVIRVTGHTDRLGPNDFNVWLSTRRAASVKRYLVESAAIPADKIAVEGIGSAQPVTSPGKCVGSEATEELVACLQPDRRVEVEVFGMKH